jgi:VCBS repeat-containing protein
MYKRINRGKHFGNNSADRRRGSRMFRVAAALAAKVEPMEQRVLMDATATFDYRATAIPLQAISLNPGDPGVKPFDQLVNRPDALPPDDVSQALDLGDNRFTLYGTTYRQLWVSTNGLITLGDDLLDQNAQYFNDGLDTLVTQPAIAPQWDDWRAVPAGSGVFYKLGKDELTIEWKSLDHYPGTTDYVTFQAVLQLNTGNVPGDIIFNYPDLEAGVLPGVESFSNGASATIGIKDRTPLGFDAVPQRLLVSNNVGTNPLVQTGKAIRIAVNKPPVLDPLADVTVAEGGTVTLSASATDPDPGDVLTYEWNLDGVDGWDATGQSVPFPAAGLDGPGAQAVTVRVTDGHGHERIGSATVNIQNAPPVTQADAASGDEDATLFGNVLANDADPANVPGKPAADVVTASLSSGPSHGSLVLNADGNFTYTPAPNYFGTDTFSYTASDGEDNGTSAPTVVTLTVNPVNDAPVSADDSVATDEDAAVAIAVNSLLANDSDADGDRLTGEVATGPSHGTLTSNPDGTLTYTPATNFNGTDSFTYRASDGSAFGNAATVTVRVAPVNDAPAAAPDSYEVDEDGSLAVAVPGVLGNDADVDGEPLTVRLVTGPGHGTLALNADGSFRYTPEANYNGPDSFTYRASDGLAEGAATVNLAVRSVNDAPQAADDAYATTQGVPLAVARPGVLGNDADADADALRAVVKVQPAHGSLALAQDGSFSYVPAAGYSGDDWFTYAASDGLAESAPATVRFTIAPGNVAPVAVGDDKSAAQDTPLAFDPLANDTDADGDALTLDGTPQPQFGTVTSPDGRSLVYQPRTGFYGTDSFEYRVSDGHGGSATAKVTVTVTRAAAGSIYLINDPSYPGKTALVVNGTDGADSIYVAAATGGVQVSFSGTSRGVYSPTGRIIVYGYAGGDTIQVGGSVPNVAWLYGDGGNDTLNLGNGGGLVFGGSGDDWINGGSGRDIIVGGNGGDRIVGNPGDDILISAVTVYDSRFSAASHNTAWSKLYAEWTSACSFATRIANLSGPTTAGLNDVFRLNDNTVNDDLDTDVMDVLTGASGEDWFIYKYGEDRITNLSTMEIQNDLQIN